MIATVNQLYAREYACAITTYMHGLKSLANVVLVLVEPPSFVAIVAARRRLIDFQLEAYLSRKMQLIGNKQKNNYNS